jgi:hypothetical protein
LVTHRIDNLQLHHLAGQQTQRPFAIARGRRAQSQGNDLRLLLAIEKLFRRGRPALLAVQRDLEPQFDKSLPHVFHRFRATVQGFGNPRIRPSRATHIRFEQNVAAFDLLAGAFELLHNFP